LEAHAVAVCDVREVIIRRARTGLQPSFKSLVVLRSRLAFQQGERHCVGKLLAKFLPRRGQRKLSEEFFLSLCFCRNESSVAFGRELP
jgi:hypothetical protein